MKSIFKNLHLLMAILGITMLFSSCIKDDLVKLGDTGTSRVKISESPTNIQYFSPFSGKKIIDLGTIRRDAVSESDVNQALTVTVVNKKDSIDAYNDAEGTSFEPIPTTLYTLITDRGVTKVNDSTYQITFAPGVTAVPISISVDGDKWDLLKTYGMYFKFADVGGKEIASGQSELFAAIAIKNKWDGVYEVTGSMTDFSNATLTHFNDFLSSAGNTSGVKPPVQIELRTSGPNSCVRYDNYYYGGYYIPINSNGSASQYGSFDIVLDFDPVTNKITNVTNYYGQPAPANGRYASLDPDAANTYDPDTKTIEIGFRMHQPSVITIAPYVRTVWKETWKWIKDR